MKLPRGVIDYDLAGHAKSDVTWKLTGNLGGEDFADTTRGPLNEGGLYAERAGYHLPSPPTSSSLAEARSPLQAKLPSTRRRCETVQGSAPFELSYGLKTWGKLRKGVEIGKYCTQLGAYSSFRHVYVFCVTMQGDAVFGSKGLRTDLTGCEVLICCVVSRCLASRVQTAEAGSRHVRRVASEVGKAYLVWCAEVEKDY